MVLPNRQIAYSFFGFAATDLSGGRSAGPVSRFTHSLTGAVLLVLLTLFAVVANAATAVALAALLALTTSEAQANTVTKSNGSNQSSIPANQTDILAFETVSSGGTLILDNYQYFGSQSNGNASCGFGLSNGSNTFTLQNGSYFAFGGGTSYATNFTNTGFGSPFNWGAGGSWQVGGGTQQNNTLNVMSGSTVSIGRRFSVGNNANNRVNVDGAGSKFINSNANNNNPVGGTWAITNGGSAFAANVNYTSQTTFNATVSGTDPNGYGSTWHAIGGFNSLNNAANIVTINSGGFLEFENLTPTFSITSGAVNINGGGLSYGLPQNGTAYSGDLLGSNAGTTANTIGGFNWSGNNRFRINGGAAGISDNGTTAYTFANNLGATNYYALELYGVSSIASRAITFDGNNGGTLLLNGATATITGGITLSGAVTITARGTSTLTGVIGGGGTLVKSGDGTLTLSDANTYSGDTLITAGTLSISSSYLSDLAAVKIDSGAFFNLGFSGSDSIGSLWLGGLQMAGGTYDSSTANYGSYFTGNGSLVVPSVVPEPGTLVLLFTGLAFAGFSWRKRLASSRN